ncbi:tetratricopeptide repeat protein [Candidatus Sumerlaeota bacterium]|nr:tetratricopeptide repeat protein [Candidatus Sumerlaeota bacterium]
MKNTRKHRKRPDEGRAGRRSPAPRAAGSGDAPSRTRRFRQSTDEPSAAWVWLSLAIVLIAVAVTMAPVRNCGYVSYDDEKFMEESPFGRQGALGALRSILSGDAYPTNANYFVFLASWYFDIVLFGQNPYLSHLLNLLLHLVNVFLVWQCIRLFLRRSSVFSGGQALLAATIAAALFGIHPVNVEPVAWVSGRKVELALLFSLCAFLCLLSSRGRFWVRYVLAVLSYLLAVLSNASCFGFPPIFGAWWVIVERIKLTRSLLLALPFFVLVAWAGTMRAQKHTPEADVVAAADEWSIRLAAGLAARARETLDLVYPKALVPVYPTRKGSVLADFWTPGSTVGALLMAASALAIVWGWVRGGPLGRVLAFCLAWYWLALAPTFAHHHSQADRHLYPSTVGLFALVGILTALAFGRVRPQGKTALIAAWCAATAALAVVSSRQVLHWKNTEELFGHATRVTDNNHVAQINYGYSLAERGELDGAIAQYRAAVEYMPDFSEAHYDWGNALREKGQLEEAIEHYKLAASLSPKDANPLNNWASVLKDTGRLEEAEPLFRKAIELKPDYADAHQNLGILLYSKGEIDSAIEMLNKAIELDPNVADAHQNLAVAFFKKGRREDAIAEFRKALEIDPQLVLASRNLAFIYEQGGQLEEAARVYRNLVGLEPRSENGFLGLARISARQGETDEARGYYEQALNLLQSQGKAQAASQVREKLAELGSGNATRR